jgi:hypothetical protein
MKSLFRKKTKFSHQVCRLPGTGDNLSNQRNKQTQNGKNQSLLAAIVTSAYQARSGNCSNVSA